MSKNSKMTKIIATIMSALLVALMGYGLSQARVNASAEEVVPEVAQALDVPEGTAAQLDVAFDEEGEETGDEEPALPNPTISLDKSSAMAPGSDVTITLQQKGIALKGTDKLTIFSMGLSGIPNDLTVKSAQVTITPPTVDGSATDTVVYPASATNGTWDPDTCTFDFDASYLSGSEMEYDADAAYKLNVTFALPALDELAAGQTSVSLVGIKGATTAKWENDTVATTSEPATFPEGTVIALAIPSISATMTVSPSVSNVYAMLTYNVTITAQNVEDGVTGIVITDSESNSLSSLNVKPTGKPTVTMPPVSFTLPDDLAFDSSGNLTISLPSAKLVSGDSITISYQMMAGNADMKNPTDGRLGLLQQFLALDEAARTRTVTVTSTAPALEAEATKAFDVMVPTITSTVSTSEGSTPSLTTGETLQVTSTFTVDGPDGVNLIEPYFNITDPDYGTVSNIKVNGTAYKRGDTLQDVPKGGKIILTYDVTATSDFEEGCNSKGIPAASYLFASNLVDAAESKVQIGLAIPEASIAIEAQPTTPSASSMGTVSDSIVHVKATVSEVTGSASLDGFGLGISESLPADATIDPAASRFQNVMINGEAAGEAGYAISGTTITIEQGAIAAGGSLVVEYDDYMKSGYEQNGAVCNVTANVQATPGAAGSTFPANQAKTATTSYAIQTPLLHISQEITGPVTEVPADSGAAASGSASSAGSQEKATRDGDEAAGDGEGDDANSGSGDEGDDPSQGDNPLNPDNPDAPNVPTVSLVPDVINVGDVVTYKTTFYEDNPDMPTALGRNFSLKVSIDDLVISSSAASNGKDKDDAEADGKDDSDATDKKDDSASESADSKRTYKASQLGITFGSMSDVKLLSGNDDVTDSFDIALSSDKDELSITPKEGTSQDCPSTPTSVEFSVKMGAAEDENNFDQLAGNDITVRATASVSNLEKSVSAVSTTTIADAKLSLSMAVSNTEISHGMTNTYTITAVNDKEDKFSNSSKARNVHIENGLDDSAKEFGYKIDPASLNVTLDGKDITSTSDVTVKWADGNTGFDMVLSRDLPKEKELVVTYAATTDGIDAQAYSETLGDIAIATADNSKPAVAYANILYTGADFQDGYGSGAGANGANGSIGSMGDVVVYVIVGVASLAIIGIIAFVMWRRRQ